MSACVLCVPTITLIRHIRQHNTLAHAQLHTKHNDASEKKQGVCIRIQSIEVLYVFVCIRSITIRLFSFKPPHPTFPYTSFMHVRLRGWFREASAKLADVCADSVIGKIGNGATCVLWLCVSRTFWLVGGSISANCDFERKSSPAEECFRIVCVILN